ncbi:futalosine hydrolase [Hazenella coriacea]|uniref:Futalosine hydrolase n=1 Tax=Hazenella coriacea TaxID=1179467 RepID=A0A4V2UVH9_9BACL|nr:futalosine hydrolase [Hazenella coriacea]TCS95857.1 futalosine hydrolase [Hazenella coriacea]
MSEELHTQSPSSHRRVLIVTAVEAEREAVLRGLGDIDQVDVLAAGVGPVMVAVRTAMVLAKTSYDLVIIAGIGGGFVGQAEIGELVIADQIIAADLGAETPEGYMSLDELGFGSVQIPVHTSLANEWADVIREKGLSVTLGPVLTVSTVTGTAETTEELAQRVPSAAAEAMEGFGVATAAHVLGIPVLEIRAISNRVGPRDRSAWRIGDALKALEVASASLKEVLT